MQQVSIHLEEFSGVAVSKSTSKLIPLYAEVDHAVRKPLSLPRKLMTEIYTLLLMYFHPRRKVWCVPEATVGGYCCHLEKESTG